jgi:predicted Fe-Mo cluster-binding NifX family protein
MKIAISSTGKSVSGKVGEVFGRCPYFIVADIENQKIKKTEVIENKNTDQLSGAGVATARLMAEKSIDVVIVKNIGPRATDVLKQFNIAVYSRDGLIKDALGEFIAGRLKKIN